MRKYINHNVLTIYFISYMIGINMIIIIIVNNCINYL